jgi:hypothetical protein
LGVQVLRWWYRKGGGGGDAGRGVLVFWSTYNVPHVPDFCLGQQPPHRGPRNLFLPLEYHTLTSPQGECPYHVALLLLYYQWKEGREKLQRQSLLQDRKAEVNQENHLSTGRRPVLLAGA